MSGDNNSPKYVSLKDIMPTFPIGTPTPPYPRNVKTRYVKVKQPSFRGDGVEIHWREVRFREEEDQEQDSFLGFLMNICHGFEGIVYCRILILLTTSVLFCS